MERMKSLLGVLLAVVLLVAGAGIAGASVLVVDRGHGQTVVDLSVFIDSLKSQGWQVRDLTTPVTAAALSDCSLLLVPQPITEFGDDEVAAVHSYVQGGGGLWVLYDADAQQYFNKLPMAFGVTFNAGVVEDWDFINCGDGCLSDEVIVSTPTNLASDPVYGPLFAGVTAFTYYRGVSLNPGSLPVVVTASTIAYVDGVPQNSPPLLAAAEIGDGRVVFMGDTTLLESSTFPFLPNDPSMGNETKLLVDNILAWLKKPEAPPEAGPIPVTVKIRPWWKDDRIDLESKGAVRVALLSTPEFNVKQVDPKTVRFAEAKPLCWMRLKVDRDRDKDLLFLFPIRNLKLTEESTEATLTGKTLDGKSIEGKTAVQIVQHKKCKKPDKPDNKGNNCEGKKR